MRVILAHNPGAGDQHPNADELVRAYQDAGHEVTYQSVDEDRWEAILDTPADAVVAAGGDGTVRSVILALVLSRRRPRIPLAIQPEGTANNIAGSLKIAGEPEVLARRLESCVLSRLAVGRARAPWGQELFVEAAGAGIFAVMLREDQARRQNGRKQDTRSPERKMERGVRHLRELLGRWKPRWFRVEADGRDVSGEYYMVQAMNLPRIGAGVELAPDAFGDDVWLDLVLAGPDQREALEHYFDRLAEGGGGTTALPTIRARKVCLEWPRCEGHVDDTPWPEGPDQAGEVTLSVETTIPVMVRPRD